MRFLVCHSEVQRVLLFAIAKTSLIRSFASCQVMSFVVSHIDGKSVQELHWMLERS